MKNIWIITLFTLREALARKVILFFIIISAMVLVSVFLISVLVDLESFTNVVGQGNNQAQLSEIATSLQLLIVNPLSSLCLLLAIFSCASFIPNMLEKGNIDLLLSKPISRSQLLLGKYFGGLLVVFLNISFLIIGVWMIISFKFSFWNFSFLTLPFVVTFTFAVLYAAIIYFGVVTKNSILGMMIAYFIYIILSPVLLLYKEQLSKFVENDFVSGLLDGIYYIIPKTAELMNTITVKLASGDNIENYQPVITSLLFLIFVTGISIFIFKRKDF